MKLECSCKNISIDWTRSEGELHSRVCSCNYCRAHKAEYVSEPDSSFSYCVKDPTRHKVVRHGHETACFHECTDCGLVMVTCEIEGAEYGIINAKVVGLDNCILEPKARDYSGETVNSRLSRRKENWCKLNS